MFPGVIAICKCDRILANITNITIKMIYAIGYERKEISVKLLTHELNKVLKGGKGRVSKIYQN